MSDNPNLISCEWLAERLGRPNIKVVDGSWYLPTHNRDPKTEYAMGHIPRAVFFDIDALADQTSGLPHSLLSSEAFGEAAGNLGISEQDMIIVYDGMGLFSAARVWWNFRIMGAHNCFVLDGGLPEWKRLELPLESKAPKPQRKSFRANLSDASVTSFDMMQFYVEGMRANILDARPRGRFTGDEPEPRPGMRSGHMPGAASVPAMDLVENGKLKPRQELAQILRPHISDSRPIITTCGSGVTAAILTLALDSIGVGNHSLYDGS